MVATGNVSMEPSQERDEFVRKSPLTSFYLRI